ncbi:hypothetical protein O6P43_007917 [Quillaja saponaria]|uniref:Uncharacterized protein n=1 Tax=Quillaja saponaria TaxID=32244 RepID=A0AAD7M4J4_QUISA|nr:hypothetical protein O6P43_007917 [Quillaja saponaria]
MSVSFITAFPSNIFLTLSILRIPAMIEESMAVILLFYRALQQSMPMIEESMAVILVHKQTNRRSFTFNSHTTGNVAELSDWHVALLLCALFWLLLLLSNLFFHPFY